MSRNLSIYWSGKCWGGSVQLESKIKLCSGLASCHSQVGKDYIIDATEAEESQLSSAISISINRQGHICGLTKRRGAGVDPSIILDMSAKHVSEHSINTLDSEIAAAEARGDES